MKSNQVMATILLVLLKPVMIIALPLKQLAMPIASAAIQTILNMIKGLDAKEDIYLKNNWVQR